MKNLISRLMGAWLNALALVAPRKAGRAGFYLFCTPFGASVKKHQQQFLDGASKFQFDSEGTTLQGYRWGNGKKKILLLHGWQSHSFRWKNYISAFSHNEYSLYAWDAPAHGNSGGHYLNLPIYSVAIENFLREFGAMDAIISHSLGSFASLYTAFRLSTFPLKQLVLMGTPGEVADFVKFYKQSLGLTVRATRAIDSAFVDLIQHPAEYFSAAKFAAAIHVPTLIIHDQADADAPFRHASAIHKGIKGSRMIATSGLGHNLRAASVINEVTAFVTQDSTLTELAGTEANPVGANIRGR